MKYVSEYISNGQLDKVGEIISASVLLSLGIGVTGTAIMAICAGVIVRNVLGISEQYQAEAILAVYISCLNILVTMFGQIFLFVLQGIQRFDRYMAITNANALILSLGSLLLVSSGYSVVALMVWGVFTAALTAALGYWMAVRLTPSYGFTFRPSSEAWQNVFRYSTAVIGYQIFGNILLLFERALITRRFGTAALTDYVVPMTLAMYLNMMSTSLLMGMFPVVNELLTQPAKLERLYKKASKFLLTFLVFAVGSTICAGDLFLVVWMDVEFARIAYPLLVVHVLTFGILAAGSIAWQIAEGFGRPGLNAAAAFLWLMVAAPLMLMLAANWSILGVGTARLAGSGVFVIIAIFVERRFVGGVHYGFWLSTLAKVGAGAFAALLIQWLFIREMSQTWGTLVGSLAISFTVYLIALVVLRHFDDDDLLTWRTALAAARR